MKNTNYTNALALSNLLNNLTALRDHIFKINNNKETKLLRDIDSEIESVFIKIKKINETL